jgi:putative colanic acid biosynthesis acetyltransferase WcaF
MHEWRSILLRLFGAKIGRGCHVYPKVIIWAPWNLELGDYVGIGDGANCYSMARISIGDRAVVSQGAHLCTGTHDYENPSFRLMARPITIGARCWICAEAFVGPAVDVGEGAVVGARAVMFKNVPPWTVWSGNPAKLIKNRNRFTTSVDEAIATLEEA